MSKISAFNSGKILDSRGEWTVKVEVFLDNGLGASASVPQGKSVGANEAVSVSAEKALENIEKELFPVLKGMNPEDQEAIDMKMIEVDGSPNKSRIGANSLLAVSLAVARAGALAKKVPLWERLSELGGYSPQFPRLLANVINGGVHAGNVLEFQEYLLVTRETDPEKSVGSVKALYDSLRKFLERKYGLASTCLGDEGGFSPDIEDNIEPFKILKELISKGFEGKIELGLDAAATNMKRGNKELTAIYDTLISGYPFVYLEDPFAEEEFDEFAALNKKFGDKVMVCGDDLTVTNPVRMGEAKDRKSVNSVIIKPNQIGTLTETFEAIDFARENKWKVVVSHRSGETNDSFIADLAYGVGADGLKLGAPARGERVSKYNRLLEISREVE